MENAKPNEFDLKRAVIAAANYDNAAAQFLLERQSLFADIPDLPETLNRAARTIFRAAEAGETAAAMWILDNREIWRDAIQRQLNEDPNAA